MRVLIAPDKFKGAASAQEVALAISEGVKMAIPNAGVDLCPLADGGDGTLALLEAWLGALPKASRVTGPLGQPVVARWALSADGLTAIIEMAAAAGLADLAQGQRNAANTTTFGVGELIGNALNAGAKRILLAIGGSATNDGGVGMATALGYRFLNAKREAFLPVGGTLHEIVGIDNRGARLPLAGIEVVVACDVENPLLGPEGATYVYGPQKGADAASLDLMERGMTHLNNVWKETFGTDLARAPGAGAAGGMGAGAEVFLGGKRKKGIDLVMEWTGFREKAAQADLILTAEGRLDEQTLSGKVIKGVCDVARQYGVPVAAFCGQLDLNPDQIRELGLVYANSIQKGPVSLQQSLQHSLPYLTFAAWQFAHVWQAARQAKG